MALFGLLKGQVTYKDLHAWMQYQENNEIFKKLFEKDKINGAIRTDFILSAEIIVIALGTVKEQSFLIQSLVVASIAFFITIFVYGLVAGIVKLDDVGLHLIKEKAQTARKLIISQ